MCRYVQGFDCWLFLKASAYYTVRVYITIVQVKKCVRQLTFSVSENFGVEILHKWTRQKKNILKGSLTQNFIAMKIKELVTQKCRQGPDEDSDKFCTGMNCIYNTCRTSGWVGETYVRFFLVAHWWHLVSANLWCNMYDQLKVVWKIHRKSPQWRRVHWFASTPEVEQIF
jgi:hypothetical protein